MDTYELNRVYSILQRERKPLNCISQTDMKKQYNLRDCPVENGFVTFSESFCNFQNEGVLTTPDSV